MAPSSSRSSIGWGSVAVRKHPDDHDHCLDVSEPNGMVVPTLAANQNHQLERPVWHSGHRGLTLWPRPTVRALGPVINLEFAWAISAALHGNQGFFGIDDRHIRTLLCRCFNSDSDDALTDGVETLCSNKLQQNRRKPW